MFLVLLLLSVVCGKSLNASHTFTTCGGNCPSNDCSTCRCGTSRNPVNIATYCSRFSDWSQSCCTCIAKAESGGNANAQNDNTNGSTDIGLYQINSVNWASCSGGAPPCNPSVNVDCAHKVWQWGHNTWRFWSTCSKCGCCNSH